LKREDHKEGEEKYGKQSKRKTILRIKLRMLMLPIPSKDNIKLDKIVLKITHLQTNLDHKLLKGM